MRRPKTSVLNISAHQKTTEPEGASFFPESRAKPEKITVLAGETAVTVKLGRRSGDFAGGATKERQRTVRTIKTTKKRRKE